MRQHVRGLAFVLILPLGVWGAMQTQQAPEPRQATTPGKIKLIEPPATGAEASTLPGGEVIAPVAAQDAPETPAVRVDPKPISGSVKRGLDWLVEHQLKDGGWGQGDESQQMGGGAELRDKANVADTCVAALALIRSGSTPSTGPYKDAIAKAVRFVRSQVEGSDAESLAVSSIQGTRVQAKLGPNIDTFLASLLLAEVKDRMADSAENATVEVALNKVLGKIKAHQKADGSWDNQAGWAPILAQSMAGKGINRAFQRGAVVDASLLAKTEDFAKFQFAQSAPVAAAEPAAPFVGPGIAPVTVAAVAPAAAEIPVAGKSAGMSSPAFGGRAMMMGGMMGRGGMGSAGVELYDRASSLAVLSDSVNTNKTKEAELRRIVETSRDEPAVADAKKELDRFAQAQLACDTAQAQVIARLDDQGFLAGFGSNGGEEFLSYMNIGESLVQKGGPAWKKWDDAITANLNRIQNDDGSWTGHHCITGRSFCTSTALLVLLCDRTPTADPSKEKAVVQ
ncbi:hypothetical protein P12x_005090 [Tundrisphaera lichenicola]|uniref:hypothetical protein n=1 Tax=Tundrisphaera lichenicola TaxID=2029860 RepID=UPI003EB8390B